MELDKEKIFNKIQIIEENLKKLLQLRMLSLNDFMADFRNVESAKHLLQTAVEAMIDITTHIIARYRLPTPATSVEAMKLLAGNGIIPSENQERYCEMIRFRNRLVHFYQKVEIEELHQILQNDLPDFEKFIRDITAGVGF